MAASEAILNKIHEFFAEYLLDLLTRKEDVYNDQGEVLDSVPYRISAAELGVITKFLKDNNISFAGEDEDDEDLAKLRLNAKEAAQRAGFTEADIEAAKVGLEYRTTH